MILTLFYTVFIHCSILDMFKKHSKIHIICEEDYETKTNMYFMRFFSKYATKEAYYSGFITKYLHETKYNPGLQRIITRIQFPAPLQCAITKNFLKRAVCVYFTHSLIIHKDIIHNYKRTLAPYSLEEIFIRNIKFINLDELEKKDVNDEVISYIETLKNKEEFYYITFGFTLIENNLYNRYITSIMRRKMKQFVLYRFMEAREYTKIDEYIDRFFEYHGFVLPEKLMDAITCRLMKVPMKLPTCDYYIDHETVLKLLRRSELTARLWVRCPFTRYYILYDDIKRSEDIKYFILIFLKKAGIFGKYLLNH